MRRRVSGRHLWVGAQFSREAGSARIPAWLKCHQATTDRLK